MCTRVLWSGDERAVLVGRNMDWGIEMDTRLWVMPRGAARTGLPGDANPLRWTASYGSVIASSYDLATSDGVNEAGLAAHLLWLAESDFGPREADLPALAVSLWAQYLLDTCATVAEAVELMRSSPFQPRPVFDDQTSRYATVHLALDDASGDSAIVEYLDGRPSVHHGERHRVMTNSPPFDEQLTHLERYVGFGGELPLPGTTDAADRFVRASYYLDRLPRPETLPSAYAALLSVMRNAAQPFGAPDPDSPNISKTIWRTLTDLTNLVYAFESSTRPDIVWVELRSLDFSRTMCMDPASLPIGGAINDRFAPAEPFEFATA
ncbi:linear amide C-N hydrolase [Glycomyces sp. L485]|uniref:linear amide C-N hydrolase n=1 Tax=Glycomyces sp. L485 TaxID=2909235 RepID=UPI001F4AB37B|nr:linear amide C-N hydrolase [Glycomyces sp. L485]MCH7229456.1 linear amide C-N hydrolase [Glycomyces sp. L485]